MSTSSSSDTNKKMIVAGIVGGVVVTLSLGAIGGLIYYATRDKKDPAFSSLENLKIGNVKNPGKWSVDKTSKKIILTIGPMTINHPGGVHLTSNVISDVIKPTENREWVIDNRMGYVSHPNLDSGAGLVVMRLYPDAMGKTRLTFHYSPNSADGAENSTLSEQMPQGTFKILKPLSFSWAYA